MTAAQKPWTSEQERLAREWSALQDNDDVHIPRRVRELYGQLESELGEDGWQALQDFLEADETSKAVVEETPPVAESSPGEKYDLLPFEIWVPELEKTVPAVGYMIDEFCRPHGASGRRRKRGPLKHQHGWRRTKGDAPKFFNGYALTLGGRQRRVTDRSLAMARHDAEKKRYQREDEL